MNDPVQHELLAAALRRSLTPAEEARLQQWLASRPEARSEWEQEQALNGLLDRLPPAPLPVNFTAQVLRAIEREPAARPVVSPWSWLRALRWTHQAALAAVVIGTGVFSYQQYEAATRARFAREVLASSRVVAALTDLAGDAKGSPVASVELLRDFETIRRFGQVAAEPGPDVELLAMLP